MKRSSHQIGAAEERIPFGATVLVRLGRVSLAPLATANGTAAPRLLFPDDEPAYAIGQQVAVRMFDDLGERDLHAIAAGPLMDPNRIYLPAGMLSRAEAAAREAANWQRIA